MICKKTDNTMDIPIHSNNDDIFFDSFTIYEDIKPNPQKYIILSFSIFIVLSTLFHYHNSSNTPWSPFGDVHKMALF